MKTFILFKVKGIVRPSMSAQFGSSDHAGKVAVLVSRLALPSPPPKEVALWTIASCNTLCCAPCFPDKVTTKSLRETCEAVRDAVELIGDPLAYAVAEEPLDAMERSTLEPIKATAIHKHFFVLGMSMSLELDGDLVRVGPSPVHGLGVFAAADIPKHTCFTAYPMDLLELWEDAATRRSERKLPPKVPSARAAALFSRKHKDIDRNVRLRKR